ncbi:CpsD/CapB family tyrosine-protein kinase [Nocardioides sp. W3-2-3]|nr:CpsD/CapB family tyrosine-protein kinase [Nocardioides convexus]
MASIGFDNDIRSAPLLTDLGGFAARTEAFRLLRTNLQFIDLDHQPRCLVISSAVPGEGKTMTSTNLAVALAQTGRNTLIIDADLRRPRVATTLGLDPAIGLTTALVGKTEIHDAIQVHEASGLHVLASGAKPPNPTEILQSKITHDLIRRLRSSYDMVIIDAPPLLPVADASVLAKAGGRRDHRRAPRQDHQGPGQRGHQPPQPGRRPPLRRRGQHGRQARRRLVLLLLLRGDRADRTRQGLLRRAPPGLRPAGHNRRTKGREIIDLPPLRRCAGAQALRTNTIQVGAKRGGVSRSASLGGAPGRLGRAEVRRLGGVPVEHQARARRTAVPGPCGCSSCSGPGRRPRPCGRAAAWSARACAGRWGLPVRRGR